MVDSLEGLSLLEQALFGPAAACSGAEAGAGASTVAVGLDGSRAAAANSADGSSGSGLSAPGGAVDAAPFRSVVGLDCEWQPYERGAPHTPVALLQLAVRQWPGGASGLEGIESEAHQGQQQVFLLDLLALCRSPDAAVAAVGGSGGCSSSGGEAPGTDSQPVQAGERQQQQQEQQQAVELTREERLLSDLLQRLFEGADVVKVGFKLRCLSSAQGLNCAQVLFQQCGDWTCPNSAICRQPGKPCVLVSPARLQTPTTLLPLPLLAAATTCPAWWKATRTFPALAARGLCRSGVCCGRSEAAR